jgi:peroxiredoxin
VRRRPIAFAIGATLAAAAILIALTGCTQSSTLDDGLDGDYVSGDGTVQTIAPENREAAIDFAGTTDAGDEVSSSDLTGSVVVLNFWYASCPPCRREAPDLVALHDEFADQGVVFLGVNIRDSGEKAKAFEAEFGVPYPSFLDAADRDIVSAFAGQVPPSAVPTTLVLDAQGRVAARFTGLIESRSTVVSVIETLLAEGP